jgi:hypothetical protein
MKRFKRWSLGTWERKLRGLDGYERLPGEEHVTAADVGVTNVFGVGSECRVFLSERALYLLSTVPKAKGVPQFGTDMMATRVSFESVRAEELHKPLDEETEEIQEGERAFNEEFNDGSSRQRRTKPPTR